MSQFGELSTEVRRLRRDVDDLQKLPGGFGFIPDQIQSALDEFDLEDARLNGNTFAGDVNWGAGNVTFSSGGEQQVKWNFAAGYIGFYGRDSDDRVGMYDWANTRAVWYYDPGGNLFRIGRDATIDGTLTVNGNVLIDTNYSLRLVDAVAVTHYFEEDPDGVTEGIVLRTSTNPATGGRIFSVMSSGAGDRLIVKHGAATESPNGFLTATGITLGGSVEPVAKTIYFGDVNTYITEGATNSIRLGTDQAYTDIGPLNTTWSHNNTSATGGHYFYKGVGVQNDLGVGGGLLVGNYNIASTNVNDGQIWLTDSTLRLYQSTNDALRVESPTYGYVLLGGQSTSYYQFYTDRAYVYFNKEIQVNGDVLAYGDLQCNSGLCVGNNVAVSDAQIWIYDSNLRLYDNGSNYLRIYSNAATLDVGWSSANSQWNFNASGGIFTMNVPLYMTGGSSLVAGSGGTSGLYASYANSVSNAVRIFKESANGRIDLVVSGTVALWVNYSGDGAGSRTTRFGNGNAGYGNIHADNFVNESTRGSKRNIRSFKNDIPSALSILDDINVIAFEKPNSGSKSDQRRIGMLAEELADVLPEVVAFHPETNIPEGIDYGQIVPLLIEAIKELKEMIQ